MIVQALGVLKEQGRAEETSVHGCWRLHLVRRAESGPRNLKIVGCGLTGSD